MANEGKRDDISGLDALEELYSGSTDDADSDELANLDMSDISIDEILEASDNVEVSSLDALSDVMDTSEIDALLASDETETYGDGGIIDTNIEGAHDSGINIDDIDLENLSLEDLMTEDFEDYGNNEGQTDDGSTDEGTLDEQPADVVEEINDEQPEDAAGGMTDEQPAGVNEGISDGQTYEEVMPEGGQDVSEVTETEETDDITVAIETEDTDTERSDDILPALDEIASETEEESDTEHEKAEEKAEEDIDLMKLLASDEELELLDDENDNSNTNYTTDGRQNVKDNVFAEPLSVLNDDENEEEAGVSLESDDAVSVDDIDNILDDVKEKSKKKKKKKGKGFKKLFANIVDDKEIEKANKEKEEAEQAEKNKAVEAEKKKIEAEEKAKQKEEKKAAKAAAKEAAKQEKEAKKRAKKEAKELRELEEESEIEGRINKVGAGIVFVILGCIGVLVFVGTNMFSYNRGIAAAKTYFDNGQYEESYNELAGLNLKEEDKILYNKVVTIMYVYKQLDAYETYCKEARYPQALDSLLKGIREYEKNMPQAIELDVTDSMDAIKNQIVSELSGEYGITEDMAREINQITDSDEYSRRVYELAKNIADNYY